MSSNPLLKHFRTPSTYLKLPSNGKYWKEGSIDLPLSGEIPILPMTSRDEIMLRTPDALLNGEGVVHVMQSCCPNIKNAWDMPSIDVDAVLIAIRIASYGEHMEVSGKCPHCNEENTFDVSLPNVLAQIQAPPYTTFVSHGLKIKLKPLPYFSVNASNQLEFEEERMLKFIADDTMQGEERKKIFAENLNKLVDLTLRTLAKSTDYIELEDETRVTDVDQILEFYENADRQLIGVIKDKLAEAKVYTDIKPVPVKCNDCGKDFTLALEFDYSNFFVTGS